MACIARDNALKYLIKKGVIDVTRKILDKSAFNELNQKLTEVARVKYNMNIANNLFSITQTFVPYQRNVTTGRELGYKAERAVPNTKLFEELDTKIKIFEERSAQPVVLSDNIDESQENVGVENIDVENVGVENILEINEVYSKNSVFEYKEVNINEINDLGVREATEVMTEMLSQKLGVKYERITSDEAVKILNNRTVNYNGEGSFYFAGTVYLVGENVSMNTVLHEFGHPLILSIRQLNPELFESLTNKFLSTGEGQLLRSELLKEYPELGENTDLFKEELLTYALQMSSANKINKDITSDGFQKFIKNLLASIKKILRTIFGNTIKVSKINEDTKLDELTDLVLGDKKIDLEFTKLTEDGIARFGKELVERAKSISKDINYEKISEIIERVNKANNKLFTEARKYRGLDSNARSIVEKAFFDGNKLIPAVRKTLAPYLPDNFSKLNKEDALQAAIDAEEKRAQDQMQTAIGLVSSLTTLNSIHKNINIQLNRLAKKKNYGSRSDIALTGLMQISSQNMISSVSDIFEIIEKEGGNIDTENPFIQLVSELRTNAEIAQQKVNSLYKQHTGQFIVGITGYLNQFLKDELKTDLGNALSNFLSDQEFETLYHKIINQKLTEEDIKELVNKGVNIKLAAPIWKKYQNFVIDIPKVNKVLSGKMKDISVVNRFLEAYSTSQNPITGALSIWIQDKKTEANNRAWEKSMKLRSKLKELLPAIGYSKNNTRVLLDKLFFVDQVLSVDENGNPVPFDVYSLRQKFGGGWRYEFDKFNFQIKKAKEENDFDKVRELEYAKKQFEDDYMHREFKAEFYEKDAIWEESDLHKQAWLERKLALDKINSIESVTRNELERLENFTELQAAKSEYNQLFSKRNPDGTMKIGDELEKTEIRIEHREATKEFYEFEEIPNSIQLTFNDFINNLEAKKITQFDKNGNLNTEWQIKVNEWVNQNLKSVFDDNFYEIRTQLVNRMIELHDKQGLESEFNIGEAQEEIYSIIGLYKDSKNQPVPEMLGAENMLRIKELQQQINDARDKMKEETSLTEDEAVELRGYQSMVQNGDEFNDIQKVRFSKLTLKKTKGLNANETEELFNIYDQLAQLSTKMPTEYYLDELNYLLSYFEKAPVKAENATDYVNSEEFRELLLSDKKNAVLLKNWFQDNHVSKKKSVKEGKTWVKKDVFERIPAHQITVPNDASYILKTELTNPLTNETVTLNGIPNNRHSRSRVKNKYRTIPFGITEEQKESYIGKVIDNANNFLPRDYIPGDVNSAKDDKFINKDFQEIEKNPNSAETKLVKVIGDYLLDIQKRKSSYSKLYLDLPRFSTNNIVEAFQSGKYGSRIGQTKEAITDWYQRTIGIGKNSEAPDDYSNYAFNYDEEQNLVNTALKGENIGYVPVDGLYKLKLDRIDPDVLQSILKYGMSLENQSVLFENLPFAQSILTTMDEASKQKQLKNKGATDHGLEQLRSLLNREFFGIIQSDFAQRNKEIAKVISSLQRLSTVTALAVNIPSDLKNKYGAMVQVAIEAAGGEFFNAKDMANGRAFAFEAMMNWSSFGEKGIYAIGPAALTTQLIEIYDPVFKTKDEFGRSVQRSMWKDLVNGEWLYMHRRFGEMEVGITLFGSFMNATKVEQNIGDEKRIIKLKDAYEQDAKGIIKLKKGIDLEWSHVPIYHEIEEGQTLKQIADLYGLTLEDLKSKNKIQDTLEVKPGDELTISSSLKFKALKNRIQGVSRDLFGAYDEFGQAEGNKLIIYRMFAFMRKWFVPLWMHRWGIDWKNRKENGGYRYDFAKGTVGKGFYLENYKTLKDLIKSRGEKFKYMTLREKVAFRKGASEGLFVIASALISSMLFGFDDEDDEKWSKIRGRSGAINEDTFNAPGFLINHSLLLLQGVQAETTTYIPLPTMFGIDFGLTDQINLITNTSVAFQNTIGLYAKILQDTYNFLAQNESAYYQKKSGPYPWKEKGDLKLISDIYRLFGFTGNTFDTETALKNMQRAKQQR